MDKAMELKLKVAATPLRQFEIAQQMGIDRSIFSRIINGSLPIPETFEADLQRAMSALAEEKARKLIESVGAPA